MVENGTVLTVSEQPHDDSPPVTGVDLTHAARSLPPQDIKQFNSEDDVLVQLLAGQHVVETGTVHTGSDPQPQINSPSASGAITSDPVVAGKLPEVIGPSGSEEDVLVGLLAGQHVEETGTVYTESEEPETRSSSGHDLAPFACFVDASIDKENCSAGKETALLRDSVVEACLVPTSSSADNFSTQQTDTPAAAAESLPEIPSPGLTEGGEMAKYSPVSEIMDMDLETDVGPVTEPKQVPLTRTKNETEKTVRVLPKEYLNRQPVQEAATSAELAGVENTEVEMAMETSSSEATVLAAEPVDSESVQAQSKDADDGSSEEQVISGLAEVRANDGDVDEEKRSSADNLQPPAADGNSQPTPMMLLEAAEAGIHGQPIVFPYFIIVIIIVVIHRHHHHFIYSSKNQASVIF